MQTLEDAPELALHLAGHPHREIGDARGVSHEQARRLVQAQGREIVSRIAGELLLARRDGKVLPIATIPDVSGDGFSLGLRWVDWLVRELSELTFQVQIQIEPCPGGFRVGVQHDTHGQPAEKE